MIRFLGRMTVIGVRRSKELCDLVRLLMSPRPRHRRMAHEILEMAPVQAAKHDTFIVDVIVDGLFGGDDDSDSDDE